jgi:hypothetical protein
MDDSIWTVEMIEHFPDKVPTNRAVTHVRYLQQNWLHEALSLGYKSTELQEVPLVAYLIFFKTWFLLHSSQSYFPSFTHPFCVHLL